MQPLNFNANDFWGTVWREACRQAEQDPDDREPLHSALNTLFKEAHSCNYMGVFAVGIPINKFETPHGKTFLAITQPEAQILAEKITTILNKTIGAKSPNWEASANVMPMNQFAGGAIQDSEKYPKMTLFCRIKSRVPTVLSQIEQPLSDPQLLIMQNRTLERLISEKEAIIHQQNRIIMILQERLSRAEEKNTQR